MTERFESFSQPEDAFASIPVFSVPVKQSASSVEINLRNQKKSAPIDCIVGTASKSGTHVYVGKKITGTEELSKRNKKTDVTLAGFCIDTESVFFEDKQCEKNDFTPMILDADEPVMENRAAEDFQLMYGLVCDQQKHVAMDLPKANHGLSLDIRSGEHPFIPTGTEPEKLGSGLVVELLGTGGMAKVYKIWNETLEMYRAVKLLMPSGNLNSFQRFETESKISSNLKHPNIVKVHGTGEWQGLPFMEMEYVDGVTLQVFLQFFKSLPPLLCTAIVVQIARGLAYAHTQQVTLYGKKYKGIIHRDLKPSNILIGFNGVVKLMDFGVARPVETGLHTVNVESIVGTLQYFPPEQVNGYPIDQLADIYSFGAVLYEMLCGVNPFPQLNLAELIRAKTNNKYVRLHEFKMTIDPHLASLAQICLRTEKQNRVQSSAMLRDYLEDLHYSWSEQSPENVIRDFFNSTEKSCRK